MHHTNLKDSLARLTVSSLLYSPFFFYIESVECFLSISSSHELLRCDDNYLVRRNHWNNVERIAQLKFLVLC